MNKYVLLMVAFCLTSLLQGGEDQSRSTSHYNYELTKQLVRSAVRPSIFFLLHEIPLNYLHYCIKGDAFVRRWMHLDYPKKAYPSEPNIELATIMYNSREFDEKNIPHALYSEWHKLIGHIKRHQVAKEEFSDAYTKCVQRHPESPTIECTTTVPKALFYAILQEKE